jgi:HK97 family phage major capsid protein
MEVNQMLTPEQIEKQLKETADKIETALGDVKKGLATKEELSNYIDERKTADSEMLAAHKSSIDEINSGMAEVKKTTDDLQKQLKLLRSGSDRKQGDTTKYRGHFASPQEAKMFALLCICATTADTKMAGKFDWARKQLDAMGVEPYLLTESGQKAMTGSSQAAGGTLVLVEQVPSIIQLLETYGRLRANATVMPMSGGEAIVPKNTGLITMYVPGEGGTITQSTPTIPAITLTPKTLTGLTAYSIELGEDSLVALGELLGGLFARSCAYYEDLCGFLGDGTSTYFGFKGITGALLAVDATIGNIKSLIVGAGNAYSELTLANFNSVCGILPDYADDGDAKWYEHRYFYYTTFVALALAAGGVRASEVIVGAGQRQKLQLGYPVEFTQVMPRAEANDQICSLLANLRQGLILGTRGGIEIAQSSERYFDQGLIGVRVRDRVAINAHGVGDTTNAGPICGLITAGS